MSAASAVPRIAGASFRLTPPAPGALSGSFFAISPAAARPTTTLAAQTLYGAAQLALKTGHHPALLKDSVTTPAGCTIDGLIELEKGGLRVTLINAVITTTNRARELMTS